MPQAMFQAQIFSLARNSSVYICYNSFGNPLHLRNISSISLATSSSLFMHLLHNLPRRFESNLIKRPHIQRTAIGSAGQPRSYIHQLNLAMVSFHPSQSGDGAADHFPMNKREDSLAIPKIVQQLVDSFETRVQWKECVVDIIQCTLTPSKKISSLLNPILEKHHWKPFVPVRPKTTSPRCLKVLKRIQASCYTL